MSVAYFAFGLVVVQRLIELVHAHRNTNRLMARGGIEADRQAYIFFVILHICWLASLFLIVAPTGEPIWILLAIYALLQPLRYWAVFSLGPYWTTRLITVPGASLVRHGPYRFVRHPNYIVVICEIALLPLAFGAWEIAMVFSILNLALIMRRIRLEHQLLAARP